MNEEESVREIPHNSVTTSEYRPILLSRRGEYTAWGLALVCLVALLILVVGGYRVHPALPVLTGLLVLAGMGISLGNWMDRKTVIRIDNTGIEYHNGLRNTRMHWEAIERVEVYPHEWGDKVRVLSKDSRFNFRKLGEVKVGGETKGSMGFAEGDQILMIILQEAALKEIRHNDEGYYYARE